MKCTRKFFQMKEQRLLEFVITEAGVLLASQHAAKEAVLRKHFI
jgi:hypothetical protein